MRRLYIAPLLLIGFVLSAEPQAESPALQNFQISVNVDLVVLQATVRDHGGRFVSDLGEQDFEVYEDGIHQSIRLFRHEDVPVTIGLVIDHSGSMAPKLKDVVEAARTFTRSSNPEDQMFVVNFNENVTLGLPGTLHFTSRAEELERAISSKPAIGKTALYDAVVTALERLRTGGPERKVLIVISDGGDNASRHGLPEVLKMAALSSAVVNTVGIFDDEDEDKNPAVLRRLARETGGEAYFPAQFSEVVEICERIARDIRNQYTVGYVSSSAAPPGAPRAVRMAAHAAGKGKLSVRTRSSYISPGDAGSK
jgi:VWFA-related protein